MLRIVRTTGNWNLSQLMDELIAQVPTFRRVTGNVADPDMGQVHGRGGRVEVVFADDIAPALIDAVLDAHVPAPPPVPRDYKAELRGVTDLADLKSHLEEVYERLHL